MPGKARWHVVASERGWRVEVEGQTRASGTHATQQAAWQQAKQIAQRISPRHCFTDETDRFASGARTGEIRDEAGADEIRHAQTALVSSAVEGFEPAGDLGP
jgi:Uncharacterized protein conserved in bacteria (DUF2188)